MATTWNPADLTATTLSNGNLTATGTGSSGGVRSIASVSAGKWYWEVTFTGGAGPGIGVANASAALATVWTTRTNAALGLNGSTYVNGSFISGAGVTIAASSTICVATDLGAQLFWLRAGAAGNWNSSGTANPATGAGGVNIAVLGSPLFALVASSGNAVQVANFGASGFVGTIPSGFAALNSATAVAQARAFILA